LEKQKDWVLEVPGNADPMEDQFAKKAEKKKEKVAKNEFQRLRNIAKAKKIKLPKEGLPPVENPNADQVIVIILLLINIFISDIF